VPFSTDRQGGRGETAVIDRPQGKQVTNARIDRMVRELNSDPSSQFFQHLFGLVGLCEKRTEPKAQATGSLRAPALTSR